MSETAVLDRMTLVRQGRRLEHFTAFWSIGFDWTSSEGAD